MSMGFLLVSPFSLSSSSAPSLFSVLSNHRASPTKAISASPISRSVVLPINLHSKPCYGLCFNSHDVTTRSGGMIVKASSDIKGTSPDSGETLPESDDEEDALLDKHNLPLDSKLQQKLEQKMRMKLDKKIRLRRKKLVHKRRMRKKGKWPPSKVKQLKNV